jgi:hypothetical protein
VRPFGEVCSCCSWSATGTVFEAAPEPKTFVELNGGHGDAFDLDSASYFGSIERFIASLPASTK